MEQAHEFILEFGQKCSDGSFILNAKRFPSGEASGYLKLPFTYREFRDWSKAWGIIGNGKDTPAPPQAKTVAPSKVGAMLFEALFPTKVRALYEVALNEAGQDLSTLRIILKFDPLVADHVEISSLPWELLRPPESPTYICMDIRVTLVRFLDMASAVHHQRPSSKLRVVAVVANPKHEKLTPFDAEAFKKILAQSLSAPVFELHILERPTPRALRDTLLEHPCDVLHFTGHGGFFEDSWGLAFENNSGDLHFVSSSDLAQILGRQKSLKLVHLLSCETSRAEGSYGAEPFAGLAHALLAIGIPALIGMQFPIEVEDASIFVEGFYKRIAKGDELDQAIDTARQDLLLERKKSIVWATPVLFMRTRQTHLWQYPEPQRIFVNTLQGFASSQQARDIGEEAMLLDLSSFFEPASATQHLPLLVEDGNGRKILDRFQLLKVSLDRSRLVQFEGDPWISVSFTLGFVFRTPSPFRVRFKHHNIKASQYQDWEPNPSKQAAGLIEIQPISIEAGELVVSLSVNKRIEKDVAAYLKDTALAELPWLQLSHLKPDRNAIKDPNEAAAFANAVIERLRALPHLEKIHLFLAVPTALAFLIGQGLAVAGPFQVYDLCSSTFYPSFLLE